MQLARQFAEVRFVRAVLQVTSNFCLLGLRTAAPHWVDPLAHLGQGGPHGSPWRESLTSRRSTVPGFDVFPHIARGLRCQRDSDASVASGMLADQHHRRGFIPAAGTLCLTTDPCRDPRFPQLTHRLVSDAGIADCHHPDPHVERVLEVLVTYRTERAY